MTILSERRIEKLEGTLLAELKPADRVSEVLKALAEGKKEVALRLVETCPIGHYTMTDPAYSERLRNVLAIGLMACDELHKYSFARDQIEGLRTLLKADENLRAEESACVAAAFTFWRDALQAIIQAEWTGFDAFCWSELHLDAATLLRGLKLIEATVLPETPTEKSDSKRDGEVRELAAKREAYWRETFRSLVNSTERRNRTGAAFGT